MKIDNLINYYKSIEKPTNPSILIFSSLLFITNTITAIYKNYFIYSYLFLFLTITSLTYHSTYNFYTKCIDQFAVLLIVLYGGFMMYNKKNTDNFFICITILTFFIFCAFLYVYGYFTKKYCFTPDYNVSEKYHFILHMISMIGHHFIIFL
jgi:hypothetical protein